MFCVLTETNESVDQLLNDPEVQARELFISDAADTYPVKALR